MSLRDLDVLCEHKWDEYRPQIADHITDLFASVRGLTHPTQVNFEYGYPSAHFVRGWGVDCNITVPHSFGHYELEDGSSVIVTQIIHSCQIGWGSTHRSVSNSIAAIDLYREVVGIAAEIEAKWQREYLISIKEKN